MILISLIIIVIYFVFSSIIFSSSKVEENHKFDIQKDKDKLTDLEVFSYYGYTKTKSQPGDVLYSSMSPDTAFVGHIGIVGSDGLVYHVLQGSNATRSSLPRYMKRFSKQNLHVLRHNSSDVATNAAFTAMAIHAEVEAYALNTKLSNVSQNYCSKFIWQAFYYGSGIDILGRGYNGDSALYVIPVRLKSSHLLPQLLIISEES